MVSSGMLRCVALVRSDVSEEPNASFIGVTRIGEPGKTLAVTSNRRKLRRNTSQRASVATQRNIPEDTIIHSHRRENLKSYICRSCRSQILAFCLGNFWPPVMVRYFRDFALFEFSPSCTIWPSARCASAANTVCRNVDVSGAKNMFLKHIL
jgi:hypothetical protein